MKAVSIINLKGGVGKTTTAANLGYVLNKTYGYNVLLVDNDKQGNLSRLLGVYQEDTESDTARLLSGNYRNLDELVTVVPGTEDGPALHVIAANMSLLTAEWDLNRSEAEDQVTRYRLLRETAYDFVIFDNPPDMGLSVINALAASDDVIVPTKIDQWALEGLAIIKDQAREMQEINQALNEPEALVTMYQNDNANNAGIEWLRENSVNVFGTAIRYSKKAAESTFFGKTVTEYSPRSAAAISYKKFAGEYLEKAIGLEAKARRLLDIAAQKKGVQ